MEVKPIGIGTKVFETQDGKQRYKTLKLSGKANEDSPIEFNYGGHRYFKQTIKQNGKEEILYVCADEAPETLDKAEAEKYTVKKTCGDGKDDGKISWTEKLSSMWNGVAKTFTNMFSSPKKAIISIGIAAAAIGACFIPGVGPFISAGLLYGGLALGVGTIGVGAYQSANAKTDAEERNAWENIGNGVFTTVTSLIGLKSFKSNLAQQATAIEQATGQAAGAVNHISKAATVPSTAEDTIKSVGALAKVGSAVKNTFVAPVKTVAAPILEFKDMPNVVRTISAVNHAKAGLLTAGASSAFKTVDLGIKASEANISHLEALNLHFQNALQTKNNVAEAHTWLNHMKTLLPYIQGDEAVVTQAKTMVDNASAAMKGINILTGTKTASTAGITAVAATGTNMTATPEEQKLQACTFVQ
ncbi:MAG: hypothetical protein K6A44_01300 [bacterium]|nr:hypothetical protein [bacterium]